MLENIKSSFFIEKVLSNLKEKTKLEIIKYNKKLQKKINIDIFNYKIFSGKYIVYETKEKGKIINPYNGNLLFEGGILKGKRNGQGKEFDDEGRLKFEGEYLDEKRNGKGKEYYIYDGTLKCEGEYLKGKRWNIIEYDNSNDTIINKLRNGKGFIKEYIEDGILNIFFIT